MDRSSFGGRGVVLLAGCVSKPTPWTPDGVSDVDGGALLADGRGDVGGGPDLVSTDVPDVAADLSDVTTPVDLAVVDLADLSFDLPDVTGSDLWLVDLDGVDELVDSLADGEASTDTDVEPEDIAPLDGSEVDGCAPMCDEKECGDDGCGGVAGTVARVGYVLRMACAPAMV